MTTVRCTSEFRSNTPALTASAKFVTWVHGLPASAALSPITVDKGTQRDPYPVLVGLRATWDEER